MIRKVLWKRKVVLELGFGQLVEFPQVVSVLGRKDYMNKGIWKTEACDYNSEHSMCVGRGINIIGFGNLSVKLLFN